MIITVKTCASEKDEYLPMASIELNQKQHLLKNFIPDQPLLPVGSFFNHDHKDYFCLTKNTWLPCATGLQPGSILKSLAPTSGEEIEFKIEKKGWSLATITLSDKGAVGLREDKAGPAIRETLTQCNIDAGFTQSFLLPDNLWLLRGLVAQLALIDQFDLIITTGGTGVGEKDLTPQAIKPLVDINMPGFEWAMFAESSKKTPHGIIARPLCGIIGRSLLITLPGSPKAVRENLSCICPALEHALKKIHGDNADCGA